MKTATRSILTLTALSACLVASLSLAQGGPGRGPASSQTPGTQGRALENFKAADSNKDGLLSRAEAEKSLPQMALRFDALDANKDGQISAEELQTMRARAQGSMRPAQAGQMMGGGHMQGAGRGSMPASGMRGSTGMVGTGCAQADADKDGIVTHDEALKMGPRFQQRFDAIDTNHDGKLSSEELNASCPARKL